MNFQKEIEKLLSSQRQEWDLLDNNFNQLQKVEL